MGNGSTVGHDTSIDSARRRGECDDCFCIAPELFQVWCEGHCFDGDNIDGDLAYCSTCVRRIARNHSHPLRGGGSMRIRAHSTEESLYRITASPYVNRKGARGVSVSINASAAEEILKGADAVIRMLVDAIDGATIAMQSETEALREQARSYLEAGAL